MWAKRPTLPSLVRNRPVRICFLTLACCLVWCSGSNSEDAYGNPERKSTARPGQCAACHTTRRVLPTNHPEAAESALPECRSCHKARNVSLIGKIPLSHFHQLAGVSCEDCHRDLVPPKPLKTSDCLQCHESYAKLASLTNEGRANPHHSPHYEDLLECDVCHHVHRKSENFCGTCHEWKLLVP